MTWFSPGLEAAGSGNRRTGWDSGALNERHYLSRMALSRALTKRTRTSALPQDCKKKLPYRIFPANRARSGRKWLSVVLARSKRALFEIQGELLLVCRQDPSRGPNQPRTHQTTTGANGHTKVNARLLPLFPIWEHCYKHACG
jgi:hypothetical protein